MSFISLKSVNFSYPNLQASNRSFKQIFTSKKISTIAGLKNLNFTASEGDRIGVIGHNGAGKTTFLKLLAGIYAPHSGDIEIKGKLTSLLNINLGINDELTGLENIQIRGLLMGLSKKDISIKLEEIVKFTELDNYIDLPVKTYSAGMRIRLAFSVCTAFDPEILIMDEWLSAGDEKFQLKANSRLSQMMDKSKILILASHNLELIKKNCTRVIQINNGSVVADTNVEIGIIKYKDSVILAK